MSLTEEAYLPNIDAKILSNQDQRPVDQISSGGLYKLYNPEAIAMTPKINIILLTFSGGMSFSNFIKRIALSYLG